MGENLKLTPALCLDWDGTIRRSKSGATFIKDWKDIELIPDMERIIWRYRDHGHIIIGISNQAGVAHGFKLPMEIERERDATIELFERNPFHIVEVCFHDGKGNVEPYCHRSLLRKPDYGMLAIAEGDAYNHGYIIDWDKSLFVGDRPEDEQCAENAGIFFRSAHSFLNEPHTFEI